MHSSRLTLAALVSLALTLVVACGGGASPSPSSTTAAAAPSAAASAPASAAATQAAASEGAPSLGLPSFQLPSSDKEVEALLPDKLCGKGVQKASVSGAQAVGTDEDTQGILRSLGKSPSDVSLAIAFADPGTNAGCKVDAAIFRVKGANSDQLANAFKEVAQKQGEQFSERSVGGKNVYVSVNKSGDTTTYAYFNGDALLFVTAPDDATAGPALQDMP